MREEVGLGSAVDQVVERVEVRAAETAEVRAPHTQRVNRVVEPGGCPPHGGRLIDRRLRGAALESARQEAATLPALVIDQDQVVTLEMIATGVLSPLEGFMGEDNYRSVLHEKRLASGLPWTIPMTLAPAGELNRAVTARLGRGDRVALADQSGHRWAVLTVTEKFTYDRDERAVQVFATDERRHPGVDYIHRRMGDTCLAGPIDLLERPDWGPFEKYRLEPVDTRRVFFEERGWRTVVGFQTANPLHRGHEYLQKCALEIIDGLFIHPIVETTRKAYFRNEYRIEAYKAALDNYYPADRVVLAPLRVTMTYAGPREAILHAIVRKNFGCTHFIVGRDHAGFGGYYDKYAAWRIFDEYDQAELGIQPLFFRDSFYCTRCGTVATEKTCPHGEEYHLTMSGTGVQDILRYGYLPPKEILRPEVGQVIIQGIQPKGTDADGAGDIAGSATAPAAATGVAGITGAAGGTGGSNSTTDANGSVSTVSTGDGQAIKPVADTIKGLFPYYLTHHRLGGKRRRRRLDPAELTMRDLEAALAEGRERAGEVYQEVFEAVAGLFDIARAADRGGRIAALREALRRQKELITALEEKVRVAQEEVPDPFMFQDRPEAQRELDSAREIAREIAGLAERDPDFKARVWNPMPYEEYRR
ncbi:MAG: sulfate adenylyltransferase [Firmicutes bacterium]|nr:sulfate adenylyltransferase [Bacillota bacterium]